MFTNIKKYQGHKMPIVDLATSIAQAIQNQEGYGTPNAITINANNNPGALRSWPGYPTVNGMAQFPSYGIGYQALVTDVTTNINKPGFTLTDFITRYEGGTANVDNNNIPAYIANVSSQTGIPANVPLSSLVDSQGLIDATNINNPLNPPAGGGTPSGSITDSILASTGIDFSDPTNIVIAVIGFGLLAFFKS